MVPVANIIIVIIIPLYSLWSIGPRQFFSTSCGLCLLFLQPPRPSDSKPCQLARLETDALPVRRTPAFGSETVSFSNFLGQTPSGVRSTNPAVFGFDEWPGGVKLRVFVTCCGVESEAEGRCQETLTFTARAPPLPGTPGWEGVECQKDMDECRLNLCHNSATCTNDPPGSFTCHCPLGRGADGSAFNGSLVKRYKFSKGTSFYSVCIKTKTFDNAMFDRDDNSDIICDDNGEEGGRRPHRQNSYTSYVDRYPTLAQARRSMLSEEDRHPNIVHPHRASGRSASSHVYDSCNPSAASSMRRKEGGGDRGDDGCQGYIDIINPYWTSSMSEVDVLHNQPQEMRAIRAVFTPRGTPRQSQKGQGRMKSSPALGRGLVIPQMIISQHVDPLPNGDSPRSARLAHADVYSIGGTLAPEDISGTPRSYDRRSFADAITSKGNPSEP
nr:hypothetical protein BaRGS_021585 [Batillaria attramentaria]